MPVRDGGDRVAGADLLFRVAGAKLTGTTKTGEGRGEGGGMRRWW